MLLNAQQILSAADGLGGKTVEVEVPEWGGSVLVGSMGALDYAELQDWIRNIGTPTPTPEPQEPVSCDSEPTEDDESGEDSRTYSMAENVEMMVRWCALTILEPDTHKRAFTMGQVKELGAKSMKALRRVYDAALSVNLETKESRGEAEKNSDGTTGGGSGCD